VNIVKEHLPDFCFSGDELYSLDAIVIHFFSGKYAFTSQKFDLQKCWELFVDLNLPIDQRRNFKLKSNPNRMYASARWLIGRMGQIWELCEEGYQQYHAGRSEWISKDHKNLDGLNKYSDGIELIGDDHTEYEYLQYKSLAWLIKNQYPQMHLKIGYDQNIGLYRPLYGSTITGHEFISPGRKSDPGRRFNWYLLDGMLNSVDFA